MAVEPSELKHWYRDGSRFHAVAEIDRGWSFMACGMMSTGEPMVVKKTPERICKKCREALKRMYLKPVEVASTGTKEGE